MMRSGIPITNSRSQVNSKTLKYPFGTLGGFARDQGSDKIVGITAFHSIHTKGLPWKSFEVQEIEDASLTEVSMVVDNRKRLEPIGKILKTFFDTKIEAALIEFYDDFLPKGHFVDAITCHFSKPAPNQIVTKLGAKTQATESEFTEILEEKEAFTYKGKLKKHEFSRLMSIQNPQGNRFVKGGDSGSLIKLNDQIAGMVLGKNNERGLAFGMHAFFLKRKLNITFLNHTTT